jgi:Ca2+-binding EF-hand superfamily protein
MSNQSQENTNAALLEIERLINEFKEKFQAGTSDPDHFITINEIEHMWSQLQNSTNVLYSDIVHEMMASVDESALIRKKNGNTGKEE